MRGLGVYDILPIAKNYKAGFGVFVARTLSKGESN